VMVLPRKRRARKHRQQQARKKNLLHATNLA
jgi:hypothetical protein